MPDRYFAVLLAAFFIFIVGMASVGISSEWGKVDAQRARCDAAGGVYVMVKSNPDLCLRTQTIDIGATQ